MVHPTVVIRREMALERGLCYDEAVLYAQDYKFWADALDCGKLGFLKKPVLIYRVHSGQISKTKTARQAEFSKLARQSLFAHFGVGLTDAEVDELVAFIDDQDFNGFGICPVLRRKCRAAMEAKDYTLFARELSFRALRVGFRCAASNRLGMALGSCEFWRAVLRFWYWPAYCRSLRFAKG